jgi:hypothetical protein
LFLVEAIDMKIAINICHGGFGLSPLGLERLAQLQGKECYFFKQDLSQYSARGRATYNPVPKDEIRNLLFFAFSVPNPTEVLPETPKVGPYDKFKSVWEEIVIECPDNRSDPLLIQVIEELADKASGPCSSLKIVEVPDDIKWEIQEYDGKEWVAEAHRTWG